MARPPAAAAPSRAVSCRTTTRRGLALAAATAVLAGPVLAGPASAATTGGTTGQGAGATFSQAVSVSIGQGALELALFQARGASGAFRTGTKGATIKPDSALAFAGVLGGSPQEQAPSELAAMNGALATLADPGPTTADGQAFPANPLLALKGGQFSAAVDKATAGSTSKGDVVTLKTKALGDITELQQLTDPLRTALATLLDQLFPAVSGGVDEIVTALDPLTGQLPQELQDAIDAAAGDDGGVQALLDELQQLDKLLFDTPLIALKDVKQSQQITQEAGGVRTTAATTVGTIAVLGTLLELDGPVTSAESFAGGRPGTATADATSSNTASLSALNTTLANLIIGDAPGQVSLDALDGSTDAVLAPLLDGVNTALTTLTDGLQAAGLAVAPFGAEEEKAAKDGETAQSHAAGVLIDFTPPAGAPSTLPAAPTAASRKSSAKASVDAPASGSDDAIFQLAIGDSQAISAMTLPTAGVTTTPTTSSEELPRTGAEGGLLGGLALAALAGVGLLRRRISA